MIEVMPESKDDVLVLRTGEKLTHDDYVNVVTPRVETVIQEHGKVRVVVDMTGGFRGWEPSALWDDIRLGLAHWNKFEKMAVIGSPQWVNRLLKAFRWMIRGEIRRFSPAERNEAMDWVRRPPEPGRESAVSSLIARLRSDQVLRRRLAIAGGVAALLLVVMASRRASAPRRR